MRWQRYSMRTMLKHKHIINTAAPISYLLTLQKPSNIKCKTETNNTRKLENSDFNGALWVYKVISWKNK